MAGAEIPVSEYVKRVPPSLRPTLQAGRRVIKALAPEDAREIAYRAWPIRYRVGELYVCGIGNYPRWVSIYFFGGADLDDPDGILEGTGKGMRHVKLREPKDADAPELRRMIRRAFRKGGTTVDGQRVGAQRL